MTTERTTERTGCVVAGGGPAGMVLGLLLARAGVEVTVLEKHGDFLRDFRGDTVHPTTLRLLDDLGLGEVRGRECSVRGRWATVGVNVQVEPIGGAGFTPVGRSKNAMRPCVPLLVGGPHLHLGLRCPIDHGVGLSDHVKRPGAIREADAARPFLTAASPFPHIQHAGHRVHLHRKQL